MHCLKALADILSEVGSHDEMHVGVPVNEHLQTELTVVHDTSQASF